MLNYAGDSNSSGPNHLLPLAGLELDVIGVGAHFDIGLSSGEIERRLSEAQHL